MTHPLSSRLYQFIVEYFSLEELRLLCFDLGVEFDDLGGEGRGDKARELVRWMARRQQLGRLSGALRRARPDPFEAAGLSGAAAALEALCPYPPPVPFVDRERARRDLAQALRARPGDVHTLVGLGGVGKTALAAQVVQDAVELFATNCYNGAVLRAARRSQGVKP